MKLGSLLGSLVMFRVSRPIYTYSIMCSSLKRFRLNSLVEFLQNTRILEYKDIGYLRILVGFLLVSFIK